MAYHTVDDDWLEADRFLGAYSEKERFEAFPGKHLTEVYQDHLKWNRFLHGYIWQYVVTKIALWLFLAVSTFGAAKLLVTVRALGSGLVYNAMLLIFSVAVIACLLLVYRLVISIWLIRRGHRTETAILKETLKRVRDREDTK